MMKMTKRLSLLGLVLGTLGYAEGMKDQDFDGVPDSLDHCPNTPFLNRVNAQGCTTKILTLPEDTESDSMIVTLGYGYRTNEDLLGREKQSTAKLQLSYYHDSWRYSLLTGRYRDDEGKGLLDTILKVKKRITLSEQFKLSLGVGLKLPSYDFKGNKVDYTLYSSLSYYPKPSISIFTGVNHTYIKDKDEISPLRDTTYFYMGMGYFFDTHFYASLSYSYAESKFVEEHAARTIAGTLYYQINKSWFTTLSYSRQVNDEDLHDALNFKIGYKIW